MVFEKPPQNIYASAPSKCFDATIENNWIANEAYLNTPLQFAVMNN